MKIILVLLFFVPVLNSQTISDDRINKIINLIFADSADISDYIYSKEYSITNRFAIEYAGVKNKFLIANDIPKNILNDLISGKTSYKYEIEKLEDNFSCLHITIPSLNFKREYFLKDSFLVSSTFYHSRNWKNIISPHFNFFVSNETLFNAYSIELLEIFCNKMFDNLGFSDAQKNEIRQKKIYYFLCKDESEIQKVTGFATRGIYILAQDYIITTYNTHYHELIHFLINFKLKDLPLYTHPFLQEGLAVAFGGRGGLEKHTIFETGVFLIKSGFANYNELLNKRDFQNTDASISYPIAGVYVDFLIKQIGIENFITLYRKYSSSNDFSLIETVALTDLPSEEKWNLFVDSLIDKNPIKVPNGIDLNKFTLINKSENSEIFEYGDDYLFRVTDTLLIATSDKDSKYQSKLFKQYFPNRLFQSEKYLIAANQNEISIYNLYSNSLIGKYVASFSIPPNEIKKLDEFYEFVVKKYLFDEKLIKAVCY